MWRKIVLSLAITILSFGVANLGTASAASFADNGNGTVSDGSTGLVWQQSDDGTKRSRTSAVSYCQNLSLSGYGWRLPSQAELESILDKKRTNPSINKTFFPTVKYKEVSEYWTTTFFGGGDVLGFAVGFSKSTSQIFPTEMEFYVRCVRQ